MGITLADRARRVVRWPVVGLALTALLTLLVVLPVQLGASAAGLRPSLLGDELTLALAAIAATLIVTLPVQGWGLAEAGFGRQRALRDLWLGFLAGAALLSVSVGILALSGGYRVVGVAATPQEWRGIGYGLLLMAVVGLAEETLFRGIIFRYIEAALGSWAALALTSALFGVAHLSNPAATVAGAAAIAIEAGIMLGAAYMLTRSLWLAIGIHWSWNFFQGSVFGINVSGSNLPLASILTPTIGGPEILSGGAFGIEASMIAVVVCVIFGIWLLLRARRAGQVFTPLWALRLLGRAPRAAPSLAAPHDSEP